MLLVEEADKNQGVDKKKLTGNVTIWNKGSTEKEN